MTTLGTRLHQHEILRKHKEYEDQNQGEVQLRKKRKEFLDSVRRDLIQKIYAAETDPNARSVQYTVDDDSFAQSWLLAIVNGQKCSDRDLWKKFVKDFRDEEIVIKLHYGKLSRSTEYLKIIPALPEPLYVRILNKIIRLSKKVLPMRTK